MDYKVISTDNHINEPPGTYVDRVPKALKDRAPRILRGEASRRTTARRGQGADLER